MLIDLSIVILVSVLYYLLCNQSRIINLIAGMILIYIFCWAIGVNIVSETEISETEFLIIVTIVNVWITIHSHYLITPQRMESRMSRFHRHNHNDHIYTLRNRINNFKLKSIRDRFRATPEVYLRTVQHEITQLNHYVNEHSHYQDLNDLVKSSEALQSQIDSINYHLDLAMQITFPHGLKRVINQYHYILNSYQQTARLLHQNQKIANVFTRGVKNSNTCYTYLHVNLRFPYQRLIHDRITHLVDLLVINSKGIFAFTLLNCQAKNIHINHDDQVATKNLTTYPSLDPKPLINLRHKINSDYDTLNYLISNKFKISPKVGVICTNPKVEINSDDPHFKIIKPQALHTMMDQLKPALTESQIKELSQDFRNCITPDHKYHWNVFNTNFKHTITDLLWYLNQVKAFEHKLAD